MEKKAVREEFLQKYMSYIPPDKERAIKDHLRRLAEHQDVTRRRIIFDITGNHESTECRQWAAEFIRTHTLPEHKIHFLRMWITSPYDILRETAIKFVESLEVSSKVALRTATYLLLDKENEAQRIDPDFDALENYLQKDPMLLAPIAERLTRIRQREFQRVVSDRTIVFSSFIPETKGPEEILRTSGALSRALRTDDWSFAWQILKNSSFACIAESLQFFKLTNWKPKRELEVELFLNLIEYIGFDGWDSCSQMLQETILDKNQRYQGVHFDVPKEILRPPPSLMLLGRDFTVTEEYLEGMQKRFLQVMDSGHIILHVSTPTSLDIELDEVGIASILCPISSITHREYEWIKKTILRLRQSDDFYERKVLRLFLALEKLAKMQSKKRYRQKIIQENIQEAVPETNTSREVGDKALYVLGFDFGNSTTAICCVDLSSNRLLHGRDLLKNPQDPAFQVTKKGLHLPSLIHYRSGGKKLIGFEAEKHREQNETFKLIKRSLRRGWSAGIKVEERRVKAPEAAKEFITEIARRLQIKGNSISRIGITAPVDAPTQYHNTIREAIASAFNVHETVLSIYDEATTAILGLRESIKSNKPVLVVDIGGGTTDVTVLRISEERPVSQIFSRASEDIGGADIEAIAFYQCRDKLNLDIPRSPKLIIKCMEAKHSLVDKGSMKPLVFIDEVEPIYFTIPEVNEWLEKERIFERYTVLLENAIHNATASGSGQISQIVLAGGGSKWPHFQRLTRVIIPDCTFHHDPDTYAVAMGAARAVMGLSIKTKCPYPIGLMRIENRTLIFDTIFPSGTEIPSAPICLKFELEESETNEVEIDLHRRRTKKGGGRFLLYGKDGDPFMKEGESHTHFEPLKDDPFYIDTQQEFLLWLDDRGHATLMERSKGLIQDLGSVL